MSDDDNGPLVGCSLFEIRQYLRQYVIGTGAKSYRISSLVVLQGGRNCNQPSVHIEVPHLNPPFETVLQQYNAVIKEKIESCLDDTEHSLDSIGSNYVPLTPIVSGKTSYVFPITCFASINAVLIRLYPSYVYAIDVEGARCNCLKRPRTSAYTQTGLNAQETVKEGIFEAECNRRRKSIAWRKKMRQERMKGE